MANRKLIVLCICFFILGGTAIAQYTPWLYWTLLPKEQMDEIIGEASGETAYLTIANIGGYSINRPADDYSGTFYETQYIYDQLKQYGLSGTEIVRFPGSQVWDGIKGELWEIEPRRQKIASYKDITAMLASGSATTDVKAELVWVGRGTKEEVEQASVEGKIVVTEGSLGRVYTEACDRQGAIGIVAISQSRPYFDPLQIPEQGIWRRRRGEETSDSAPKFGFQLPVREGDYLKQRLLRGEKIKVHAQVESKMESYDLEDVVCRIPGTDPNAGEIIFSAHLFEGIVKQGANDNKSGSAGILEVARVLHTLIQEGRLPSPKRTIRFLWGPEFSGTGPWVQANKDIMEKTLCNINMDMVGEWLSLNKAFFCLMRTTYGNPHYINDVMENYYRFVGEGNRERIQVRGNIDKIPHRIVAPTGADEPFYYSIETHYGASDHEVFNDWGVQVPGVMMIAWPDQWYHTSGDRVNKSDPTQMRRVAVIGAAAAYTIANADDDMAVKIASEITSNGTRRLGHQFVVALEDLNSATVENFNDAYGMARTRIQAAVINEKATLASVLEIAQNKQAIGSHIQAMQGTIDAIGNAHLSALKVHMNAVAKRLNTKPAVIKLTSLEQKAAKIIPKQTARVKSNGYRGYMEYITQVPREEREQYPYGLRDIGNSRELVLLVDGKNSVLDMKHLLDAQNERKSDLQAILNYLQILKLAGLVEM